MFIRKIVEVPPIVTAVHFDGFDYETNTPRFSDADEQGYLKPCEMPDWLKAQNVVFKVIENFPFDDSPGPLPVLLAPRWGAGPDDKPVVTPVLEESCWIISYTEANGRERMLMVTDQHFADNYGNPKQYARLRDAQGTPMPTVAERAQALADAIEAQYKAGRLAGQ